jgi:hypothetical protein
MEKKIISFSKYRAYCTFTDLEFPMEKEYQGDTMRCLQVTTEIIDCVY